MTTIAPWMMQDILESMYGSRREMVPCFIGAPGIGKTQGIYKFAEEKGVNVVTFILSNTVPSEVSGIRMPDKDTKKMEVFDDMRMSSLKDGDILFLDEILEAPPMLWSACLTLIQDRIMASGRKLPDVFIIAASNPVASPGIIPPSTRDRFQFIDMRFSFFEWADWFEKKYGVKPDIELRARLQEDSSDYNILTPRKFTKLYEWAKDVSDAKGNMGVVKLVIQEEFEIDVWNIINDMLKFEKKPSRQVINAIKEKMPDIILPHDLQDMSMSKMLETLQSMPEWDGIMTALENIEFDNSTGFLKDEEVSRIIEDKEEE